jgi:subfamily B ATP-binding cassette protein MsbA
MPIYWRMLRYVRPYTTHVAISVLLMIVFSVLSIFSIWMISPFLKTLFLPEPKVVVRTVEPDLFSPMPGTVAAVAAVAGEPGGPAAIAPDDRGKDGTAASAQDLQRRVEGLTALRDRLKARMDSWLLRGTKIEQLWRICVAFFFLWLAKNIAGYGQAVLMAQVGLRVVRDLRDDLFARLMRQPLSFFHRHRAGELISRATNDVQIANKCVNVSFTNLVRDPIFILMYLGTALVISWRLTLIALTVLPLSLLTIVQIGRRLRRYSHRQQEKLANLTAILQETVTGVRVVKAFAMERYETDRFWRESRRLYCDMFKIARMQSISSPLTEQLSVVVGLSILWYGGRQVLSGSEQLPPDLFILFLVSIFSLVRPIKELSGVNNAIQEGMAAAERIFSVVDAPSESADDAHARDLGSVRGEVVFEHVTFAYDPGEPVLRDINLRVAPGEIVALVGASGAGKSTLVDLIPRFYDPQAGRLLIDGHDAREFTLGSLRRAMGIVTQEVILFNDTVHANIAYGLVDVPAARIEAAARAANAHEFILQMSRGYDTVIGDRGVKLSGGQRQRLSIARAILRDPPILIFDEATSALDTESELLVQEAIDRLVRNRTTFVIAHRLSTIQSADRIHVLKDGRIVQTGTHAELLAQEGPYRVLHDLQFRD